MSNDPHIKDYAQRIKAGAVKDGWPTQLDWLSAMILTSRYGADLNIEPGRVYSLTDVAHEIATQLMRGSS